MLFFYPPFSHLALIRFEGLNENEVYKASQSQADSLREIVKKEKLEVMVLGEAVAPLARLRNKWRYQILLKSTDRRAIQILTRQIGRKIYKDIRVIVDIDPISML